MVACRYRIYTTSNNRSMSPATESAASTQSEHSTTDIGSGALPTSWSMSPATESAASARENGCLQIPDLHYFQQQEHEPCHGVGSVNTIRTWYYSGPIADMRSGALPTTWSMSPATESAASTQFEQSATNTGSTLLPTTRGMSSATESATSTKEAMGSRLLPTTRNMSSATETAASAQFEQSATS
ncbi:hypothetical protein OSTOST_10052 [Ostertagia ostertagi]